MRLKLQRWGCCNLSKNKPWLCKQRSGQHWLSSLHIRSDQQTEQGLSGAGPGVIQSLVTGIWEQRQPAKHFQTTAENLIYEDADDFLPLCSDYFSWHGGFLLVLGCGPVLSPCTHVLFLGLPSSHCSFPKRGKTCIFRAGMSHSLCWVVKCIFSEFSRLYLRVSIVSNLILFTPFFSFISLQAFCSLIFHCFISVAFARSSLMGVLIGIVGETRWRYTVCTGGGMHRFRWEGRGREGVQHGQQEAGGEVEGEWRREKRREGRQKDVVSERERERGIKAFSLVSIHSVCPLHPPRCRRDGKMKRERSSKQLTLLHRQRFPPSFPPSLSSPSPPPSLPHASHSAVFLQWCWGMIESSPSRQHF